MPRRLRRKNQLKAARKSRLTAAPSSWMGGMNRGPRMNGSSLMGRVRDLVPAPHTMGPKPRRTAARPMVAMTTAMTGRPISLRSIVRSSPKPKPIMPARPNATASQSGAP